MTQAISHALPSSTATSDFDRSTFIKLGMLGMLIGLAIPAAAWFLGAGVVPAPTGTGARIAFALRWLTIPTLAVVVGFMSVGGARLGSVNVDGSAPDAGSPLEMHRRVLQNTLEQFAYFVPTQLALATWLPADRMLVVPVWCCLFLLARLLFWQGYLKNPSYRSFGFMMMHPNILVLAFLAALNFIGGSA